MTHINVSSGGCHNCKNDASRGYRKCAIASGFLRAANRADVNSAIGSDFSEKQLSCEESRRAFGRSRKWRTAAEASATRHDSRAAKEHLAGSRG
jgi:hypothetical protein